MNNIKFDNKNCDLITIAWGFYIAGLATASIAGLVTFGVGLIALCWKIPMFIHLNNLRNDGGEITTGFSVASLILVSIVSGILMLIAKPNIITEDGRVLSQEQYFAETGGNFNKDAYTGSNSYQGATGTDAQDVDFNRVYDKPSDDESEYE